MKMRKYVSDREKLIKMCHHKHDVLNSDHRFVTWEIVCCNPNLPWDYKLLSLNPNITWEIIINNPNKPWDWCYLAANPNITWDLMYENLGVTSIWETRKILHILGIYCKFSVLKSFVKRPVDTIKIIIDGLRRWKWETYSFNPNVTFEFMCSHPHIKWDYYYISKFVPINHVMANPHIDWSYYKLSSNANLTLDYVKNNIDKKWHWNAISANAGIKWNDVIENYHLPWNPEYLCTNPNITLQIMWSKEYRTRFTHSDWMYENPTITIDSAAELIRNGYYNDYVKAVCGISRNRNLTPLTFDQYDHLLWSWDGSNIMDEPYYKSSIHGANLARKLIKEISAELNMRTMHPDRPLASWMSREDICALTERWNGS